MTAVDLDALDKLREAATAGPWENPYPFTKLIDAPGSTDNLAIVQCDNAADAALIVAAVNALPDLIPEARKYRALREGLDRLVATAPAMWHGDYPVSAVAVSDLLGIVAMLGKETP